VRTACIFATSPPFYRCLSRARQGLFPRRATRYFFSFFSHTLACCEPPTLLVKTQSLTLFFPLSGPPPSGDFPFLSPGSSGCREPQTFFFCHSSSPSVSLSPLPAAEELCWTRLGLRYQELFPFKVPPSSSHSAVVPWLPKGRFPILGLPIRPKGCVHFFPL